MSAFFSVIIPTYNRAQFLKKAIESVLKQTFGEFELLIIDDGSTDNTKEIVASYSDNRIKYLYQQNAERCAARNNGIVNATGKYICFLDSDDYYLPERLDLLYKELAKRSFPTAIFYTGLTLDKSGTLTRRAEDQNMGENIFDKIALSTIHSQQVCISKVILDEFKYDTRFHIGEDMELWLRLVEKYPVIYMENQFTVVTVDHDDRSVNAMRYNSYADQLRMLRYAFSSAHPGRNISAKVRSNFLGNCYYGIAKYYIYQGSRFSAILNILRAILSDLNSEQLKFRVNVFLKLVSFVPISKISELIKY